jgi:hypothetical protein
MVVIADRVLSGWSRFLVTMHVFYSFYDWLCFLFLPMIRWPINLTCYILLKFVILYGNNLLFPALKLIRNVIYFFLYYIFLQMLLAARAIAAVENPQDVFVVASR